MAEQNIPLAISSAISGTSISIVGNGTNIITINTIFPTFSADLPLDFYEDKIITFSKILPIGTQIFIKKNNVYLKTIITTKNYTDVWLSELLDINREVIYTQVSNSYELNFVYTQTINVKSEMGILSSYTYASSVKVEPLKYGLYELYDTKTIVTPTIEIDTCNIIVEYEDYNNIIKSAKIEIDSEQYVDITIEEDTSVTPSVKYLKISNKDDIFNLEINLSMDKSNIRKYISLLQAMGRLI